MLELLSQFKRQYFFKVHRKTQKIIDQLARIAFIPSWAKGILGQLVLIASYTATILLPIALMLILLFGLVFHFLSPSAQLIVETPVKLQEPQSERPIIIYDKYFSKYSKRYFGPSFDWRWFKAQAIAESQLKTDAVSHRGAEGLMQLMPRTFTEVQNQEPNIKGKMAHPEWSIAAGIYYNRSMWNKWKSRHRSYINRINFMFASYNAGFQNIKKAQKLALETNLNPYSWDSIKELLPDVTGRQAWQTIRYIDKIHKNKRRLDYWKSQ